MIIITKRAIFSDLCVSLDYSYTSPLDQPQELSSYLYAQDDCQQQQCN